MSGFKKKMKVFWRTVRECFVHSLVPAFMYLAMSGLLLVILQRHADDNGNVSRSTIFTASIICGLIGVAYNGVGMRRHAFRASCFGQYETAFCGGTRQRSYDYGI